MIKNVYVQGRDKINATQKFRLVPQGKKIEEQRGPSEIFVWHLFCPTL
jgi:hypothetical protein